MTQEKKVKYLTIALNICKLALNEEQTNLIVNLYDLICEKGGETDLMSIVKIKVASEQKFKNNEDIQRTDPTQI